MTYRTESSGVLLGGTGIKEQEYALGLDALAILKT